MYQSIRALRKPARFRRHRIQIGIEKRRGEPDARAEPVGQLAPAKTGSCAPLPCLPCRGAHPAAPRPCPPGTPVPRGAGKGSGASKAGGRQGGSPRSAHRRLQHLPEPQALPWDVAAGFFSQRAVARSAPHCPHPQSVVKHQAQAKRVQTGAQFWQKLVILVPFQGCGGQNTEIR